MLGDRSGALLPVVETVQYWGSDKFDPLYSLDKQINGGRYRGGIKLTIDCLWFYMILDSIIDHSTITDCLILFTPITVHHSPLFLSV